MSSSSISVRSTRSIQSSSLHGGASSSVHADEMSVQSRQSSINLLEFSEDDLRKSLPPDPVYTPHSSLVDVFTTKNGRAATVRNSDDFSTASSVSSFASSYRTLGTTATRNSHYSASSITSRASSHRTTNTRSSQFSASTIGISNIRPIPDIDETKQSPKDVIASLTRALGREQTRNPRGHDATGSKERSSTTLITLYLRRCEILHKIGAYDAAAIDARRALEYDIRLDTDRNCKPYSTPTPNNNTTMEQQLRKAATFRAEALCSLGYALLRSGSAMDGAKVAFQESASVARKMLHNLDSREDSSSAVYIALNDTLEKATEGASTLKKYDVIMKQLASESDTKDYVIALDIALELCPGDISLHLKKVLSLIRHRRWYHVAHYCEYLASRAVQWEGIFTTIGDLADMNPLFQKQYTPIGCAYVEYLRKNMPPLSELTFDLFVDKEDGCGVEIPQHLRMPSPKATRDVVFRLPHVLLPHYLRALRLEERYVAAVKTGAALSDFIERYEKDGNMKDKQVVESNKRLRREFDKLERTIKIKEEADSLFKKSYYDRAVLLYGQCLVIDGEDERRERSILRNSSSWSVPSPAANPAGGRLHAILHFNRSACFYALGRQEDAIKEATYAIEIHSTYMKAILRRAKCYAKIGQREKALVDYERFIMLVHEARKSKYPSLHHGPACYFALPSEVSNGQLEEVQRQVHLLKSSAQSRDGFTTTSSTAESGMRRRTQRRRKFKPLRTDGLCLCCKRNVQDQVVEQQSSTPPLNIVDDPPRRRLVSFSLPRSANFSVSSRSSRDSVRSPPPQSVSHSSSYNVVKPRPPFDRPVNATSDMDVNVDYYSVLGLTKTASESDIKTAYRQFAKEYHPDRSKSKNEDLTSQFHNVTLAYTILGDSGKKKEYDEARVGEWDC